MATFPDTLTDTLVFYPEKGYGFYPVKCDGVYDAAYFEKYKSYSGSEIAKALTSARVGLVNKYYSGNLVDIGIGAGDFLNARPFTYGYDVNPVAIKFLKENAKWCDPYDGEVRAVSCWDSLEHIEHPEKLLDNVAQFVFVSIPIFTDAEHILRSKHFRKDEHFHYFTHEGFIKYMSFHGFLMLECNTMETLAGREGINSYVFRRA